MNPNRKIEANITLYLTEHSDEKTIEESIILIYTCYVTECQRRGLRFAEPVTDGFGQQHIPHQFKQALHKYLWVNDLYLSHISEIRETYSKIINQ